ncbi:uncharacterized protein TNCV_2791321 [Trichonephila clavipes]|nr:uncharacterized protein TNCV_2791321 [Trichonephila clavipes]
MQKGMDETRQEMQKGLEETKQEMQEGQQGMEKGLENVQKCQEALKNSLEKKIDNVEEKINSVEEKIALIVEEMIAVVEEKIVVVQEKIKKKVGEETEKKVGEEIEKIREQVEEINKGIAEIVTLISQRMVDLVKKLLASGNENKNKSMPVSAFPEPVLASSVPVTAFTGPVKLSAYDGKTNCEVYKTQFSIISEANGWNEGAKACQLAASLRGEAAEVLQTLPDTERLNLNSLYNTLNIWFGQKYSKDYARLQMKTRLQKTGESLQQYASEVERLTNLAFSDHPATDNRKASADENGDVRSKRPCSESSKNLSNSLRVEKKFGVIDPIVHLVTTPSTSALKLWSDDSVRKNQLADSEIKSIKEFKESSDEI